MSDMQHCTSSSKILYIYEYFNFSSVGYHKPVQLRLDQYTVFYNTEICKTVAKETVSTKVHHFTQAGLSGE